MTKPPKKPKPKKIETEPDAWERFEKTIGKIVPPKRPKPERQKPDVDRDSDPSKSD